MVLLIVLDACKSKTLTAEFQAKIQAVKVLEDIVASFYKEHITDIETRKTTKSSLVGMKTF